MDPNNNFAIQYLASSTTQDINEYIDSVGEVDLQTLLEEYECNNLDMDDITLDNLLDDIQNDREDEIISSSKSSSAVTSTSFYETTKFSNDITFSPGIGDIQQDGESEGKNTFSSKSSSTITQTSVDASFIHENSTSYSISKSSSAIIPFTGEEDGTESNKEVMVKQGEVLIIKLDENHTIVEETRRKHRKTGQPLGRKSKKRELELKIEEMKNQARLKHSIDTENIVNKYENAGSIEEKANAFEEIKRTTDKAFTFRF